MVGFTLFYSMDWFEGNLQETTIFHRQKPWFLVKNVPSNSDHFPMFQTIQRNPSRMTLPPSRAARWAKLVTLVSLGRSSLGPGTGDPWNDLHQLWVIIWLTLNNYGMIKHIHHMWLNMNCD